MSAISQKSRDRRDSQATREHEGRPRDFETVVDTKDADSRGEWVMPVPEIVRIRLASNFGMRRPGSSTPGREFCQGVRGWPLS